MTDRDPKKDRMTQRQRKVKGAFGAIADEIAIKMECIKNDLRKSRLKGGK